MYIKTLLKVRFSLTFNKVKPLKVKGVTFIILRAFILQKFLDYII